MGKYSKFHSNYILRKKHQRTNKGTIFERDWVTIGEQHQIEKGKKPYYNDTNFLFTDNNYPSYQTRHNFGKWVASWTYDDVKSSTDDTNVIKTNQKINDIRDFAYYGSAVELIRSSINDIIINFPGRITLSASPILIPTTGGGYNELNGYHELNNPFGIDLIHKLTLNELGTVNSLRFLCNSNSNFTVNNIDITSYEIISRKMMGKVQEFTETIKYVNDKGEYIDSNGEVTDSSHAKTETVVNSYQFLQMFTEEEQKIALQKGWSYIDCSPSFWLPDYDMIVIPNQTHKSNESTQSESYLKSQLSSIDGITSLKNFPLYTVRINNSYEIEAYIYNDETILISNQPNLEIKPKKEVMDEYFNGLDGFEKQLLCLDSKPFYHNSFITPIETDLSYKYVYRDYTWPSVVDENTGYAFIDISSNTYEDYVNRLVDMATTMDELWCDNLYRSMTHESIKNFDWTYTKDYEDGDEQDNIDGGNQIMKLIRIYGRCFDDLKRLSDGIGFTTNNTYDGILNQPSAQLSDSLENKGWDVVSIIDPHYSSVKLDKSFVEDSGIIGKNSIQQGTLSQLGKWFNSLNYNMITGQSTENDFMKRLLLSSDHILRSKGTIQSIGMIMGLFGLGEEDYEISEEYRYIPLLSLHKIDDANDISDDSLYQTIENVNLDKSLPRYYDDIYSGVPLNDIYINNSHYIVPYYTFDRTYDGGLIFQGKGGWLKNNNGEYAETLSYIRSVSKFDDLLNLDPSELVTGDVDDGIIKNSMYYIVSPETYMGYIDSVKPTDNLSHYFMLKNNGEYAPELSENWFNVGIKPDDISDELFIKATEKAAYYDQIQPSNIGNNPHTGYGMYDSGEEFFEYLKKPFKYSIDTQSLANTEEAEKIIFDIKKSTDSDKIKILIDCKDSDAQKPNSNYYFNSKVIKLINKHTDSELYKKYFKNVILNYLTQIIPSSAILELEGF